MRFKDFKSLTEVYVIFGTGIGFEVSDFTSEMYRNPKSQAFSAKCI